MKFLARHIRRLPGIRWEIIAVSLLLALVCLQVHYPSFALIDEARYRVFETAFLAAIVFIILFTLLQYFQNRDGSYFFYSLYLACSLFYFIKIFPGVLPAVLDEGAALKAFIAFRRKFGAEAEVAVSMLLATTYCLFIQHFLEMKTNFPRLNRMVNFGYFLFLGYTLLDLLLLLTIGKSTAFEMAAKFSLALPAIYVMAVIYKQNNRLFNKNNCFFHLIPP